MRENQKVAMIAAVGRNLELGSRGDLVWHIAADLKNFKRLTTGHPVIMGRKTWESLPKRPLPGRLNIIMSRSLWDIEGALCISSPEDVLSACGDDPEPFVIGGAQIYKEFMPLAEKLYLTHVDADGGKTTDCWFPEYRYDWKLEESSEWMVTDEGLRFRFETWVRK